MTAFAAKPLLRRRPELRLVKNELLSDAFSFRAPAGQVRIPGLRPAGWVSARAQMAGTPGLSPREAELVTLLLLRDGRWASSDALAVAMFGPGADVRLVQPIVCRARRKVGRAVIESAYGAGYRIPGRFRTEIPTVCSRCNAPVQFEGREWFCEDCGRSGELPKLEAVDRGVGRRGYAAGTKQGKPWSEEERAFVVEHVDDMNLEELGEALDRTASAVRGFLATNNLRKPYVRGKSKGERKKGEVDGD